MQFPITIGLHRSRFWRRGLIGLALLAFGLGWFFPVVWPLRLAYWCLVAGLFGLAWRSSGLVGAGHCLRLQATGELYFLQGGQALDDATAVSVLASSVVHPWLSVLHLKAPTGERHNLVLWPDSLNPDDFRRLRVFLRWRLAFSADAGEPSAGSA